MMLKDIVQYPFDAQSDSFFCALASALLPALGYTENTPYFCAPKGQFCLQCGACGDRTTLQKHHLSIYHALLAASGVAFCFDYPQDDGVAEHSFPGAGNRLALARGVRRLFDALCGRFLEAPEKRRW